MRIIGGRARGTHLLTPADTQIRPTSDRVRESLFNILMHMPDFKLRDAVVGDLFCGTGALGLEALSRGASFCVFADKDSQSLELAHKNIQKTRFDGQSLILKSAAVKVADHPKLGEREFDLVFLDPPYRQNLAPPVISNLIKQKRLRPGALIAVEMAKDSPEEIDFPGLVLLRECPYGSTLIRLYQIQ